MEDRRFKVRYSRPTHSANRAGHDNQEDVRKILAERFIVRGRSAVLFSRNTKVGVADSDVAIKCSRSRPTEQNLSIEETDEERRGGISYDRTDKNAVYVRALGDGRMRLIHPESGSDTALVIRESDSRLLERLRLPDYKIRFRSRFLSFHKIHRRRRSFLTLSYENKQVLDDYYALPTQKMLSQVYSWNFDIFHFDTLTGGRSLLYLAYHIFKEYNFIQTFQLDTIKLLQFFSLVEDNYHDSNPYHNIVHAADVTQAMCCFIQEKRLQETMTPFEAMICLIASMSHDLDHPGVNQTFLIHTANHLAKLYQNTSVLEMHHWRYAIGLLQECGLLHHLPRAQWASAIYQIKCLILATDISRQQEFLVKLRRCLDLNEFDLATSASDRLFILQIALKCADISNPCRIWSISERWSKQVVEEFFRQGDLERKIQVPVTPICDRTNNTVAKVQTGFMEVLVRPLFVEWQRFLPTPLSQMMLDNISANKQRWQIVSEQEAAAAARIETDSSSSRGDSSQSRSQAPDSNLNYSPHGGPDFELSETEEEELEEEDGDACEETGARENEVHAVFPHEIDHEHLSEELHLLPPLSENRRFQFFTAHKRRHSMPNVRKDLSFYMGLHHDSFLRPNFLRRQSLPSTHFCSSVLQSLGSTGTRISEFEHSKDKRLSVELLTSRPKISSFISTVDMQLDYLSFVPLITQTHMLQGETVDTCMQASGCMSLGQPSKMLVQDADRLGDAMSRAHAGDRLQQPEVVGLAASWPSILNMGNRDVQASIKHLVSRTVDDTYVVSVADSNAESEHEATNHNSNNFHNCFSHPQPAEVDSLLNRPH